MTDTNYDEKVLNAVAEVESEANKGQEDNRTELSSGVILVLGKVNVLTIQALINKFKYPPVPEIFDKERGRAIKNPDSQLYQEMKAEVDAARTMAVMDAILAFGTVVEHIPENITPIESEDWVDRLELIGLDVKVNTPAARQLAWIRHVAIVNVGDMQKLASRYGVALGVTEEGVADSLQQNFQDN